jgi:hypothetical protein
MGNPMSASPGDLSPRNFNSAEVLGFSRRGFGGGPSQFLGQEQREQRLDEFQKTLGIAGPAKPTVLIDPINLQNDATRQPLNPILGTGSRGIGIGAGLSSGLSSVGGGTVAPTSPSPISELINARSASGSSLSPAISAPPSPAFFQPRPAVLEIPRRKF